MRKLSGTLLLLFSLYAFTSSAQPVASQARDMDSRFVELSKQVPGFGGYFFDDQGDLNVYLTDASHAAAARAAVADVARNRPQRPQRPWTRATAIVIRHGDYDFAQLDSWHRRVAAAAANAGVTMIDSDETSNRVIIGIAQESDRPALVAALTTAGVPLGAVTIQIMPPAQFATELSDNVRPLVGGLRIEYPGFACTLGVNVWYYSTPGFYTASHCSAVQFATEGTVYSQGGSRIGFEAYDPPSFNFTTNPACTPGYHCRYSDALFAQYDPNPNRSQGVVATTLYYGSGLGSAHAGSTTINGQLSYNSVLPYPTVGTYLDKVGFASGWTEGRVSHTCTDYYDNVSRVGILCQDQVDAYVTNGDSGSPVFQRGFYGTSFAGILWGRVDPVQGGFIYSNVNRLAQDLGAGVTYTP